MENSFDKKSFVTFKMNALSKFKIDLIKSAKYLQRLLSRIDQIPSLYESPIVEAAIERYEVYWLPLAAEQESIDLIAPIDIEWVWLVHMLSPYSYEQDCLKIVGKVIDHKLMTIDKEEKARINSEKLWKNKYSNIPFTLDNDCNNSSYIQKSSYDLRSAISRQKVFFYQVSLPHYTDDVFLENALERYIKFLYLKLLNPSKFFVPCYDMDLIWHAHQLHPLLYKEATQFLVGKMLNHDDSVNDRSRDSKLSTADVFTRQSWQEKFSEEFSSPGAMFRGLPVAGRLKNIDPEDMFAITPKRYKITISKIYVDSGNLNEHRLMIRLALRKTGAYGIEKQILKLKGPQKLWKSKGDTVEFEITTSDNVSLLFELYDCKGLMCLYREKNCACKKFDLTDMIEADSTCRTCSYEGVRFESQTPSTEATLSFQMSWSEPERSMCVFSLEISQFETSDMPENVEKLWGPIPLALLPEGVPNTCYVASHRIYNHLNHFEFTARVIHSIPLKMSAVQLFRKDKMVSVGHLIGTDQLPTIKNVGLDFQYAAIDPSKGERAFIIKDELGDWGICLGFWDGLKKGIPGRAGSRGIKGVKGIPGDPGYLVIRLLKLRERTWTYTKIRLCDKKRQKKDAYIEGLSIDFRTAKFYVSEDVNDIGPILTTALCLTLLQVLCQPRVPSNVGDGSQERSQSVKFDKDNTFGCAELALLVAGGFNVDTPCKSFIKISSGGSCDGCCSDANGTFVLILLLLTIS